jgi:hypothetical protein
VFGDPAIVQPDRNPVGRKLAALHFRRQSIAAPDEKKAPGMPGL